MVERARNIEDGEEATTGLYSLIPVRALETATGLISAALQMPVVHREPAGTDRLTLPLAPPGQSDRAAGPVASLLLLGHPTSATGPSFIEDLGREHADTSFADAQLPGDTSALALVPLTGAEGQGIGTLCVAVSRPHSWTAAEREILGSAATLLALQAELRREVETTRAEDMELRRNALQDALTGLPNRTLFMDRLEHAVERAKRHKDFRFAVVALDVDHCNLVNGSLGRASGDQLLIAIARRLEGCIRGEDTVARLGSDEFALLLESLANDADAGRVAERVQRSLGPAVEIGEHDVFPSASLGIALSSTGVENANEMMQSAEAAVFRAKRAGRARYEMFDREMHARAAARLKMESELHRAIERQEFEVFYQPLITLATGRITELEALIRWRHPERGLVAPLEFIPLAEEMGLIVPIGSWVLASACRQMMRWQELRGADRPLSLSVNVSVKEFAQPEFAARTIRTVAESGLSAASLKLEITESLIIDDGTRTRATLELLREKGIRIYLDDFGTGYSSLAYLHRFPLDAIKIDRSFVMRMDAGDMHLQLVRTVRTLARNINVAAVAEGVETASQLATLRDMGCEYAQGYLFSRPLPATGIEQLLIEDPKW